MYKGLSHCVFPLTLIALPVCVCVCVFQSPKKHLPQIPLLSDTSGGVAVSVSYAKSTGNLYQETTTTIDFGGGGGGSSTVPSDIVATSGYSRSFSGETFPVKRYFEQKNKQQTMASNPYLSTGSLSGKVSALSGPFDSSLICNESFSSDQSECVRPSPPRHHRPRLRGGRQFRMYKSLSSSEDEVRSTPELSTEDDFDLESESISEKNDLISQHLLQKRRMMKPDEILDAKMRNFLAVSANG